MTRCPVCRSDHVLTRNYAKRVGRTLGTAAGIGAGVSATLKGARIGTQVGWVAGPPGRLVGGLTGAIVGTLLWGVMGGKAGATLGEVVDEHMLDNHQCLRCGHRFSEPSNHLVIDGHFMATPPTEDRSRYADAGYPGDYPEAYA